jgi:hypothetical protein
MRYVFLPEFALAHGGNEDGVKRLLEMTVNTLFELSVRRTFHLDAHLGNFMLSCPRDTQKREEMKYAVILPEKKVTSENDQNALHRAMFDNVAALTEQVLAIDLDPCFVRRLAPDAAELTWNQMDKGRTLDHSGAMFWNVLFFGCILKLHSSAEAFACFTKLKVPAPSEEAKAMLRQYKIEQGESTLLNALFKSMKVSQFKVTGRQEARKRALEQYNRDVDAANASGGEVPKPPSDALKRPGMIGNSWLWSVKWTTGSIQGKIAMDRVPNGPRPTEGDKYPTDDLDAETLYGDQTQTMIQPTEYARARALFYDMPRVVYYWMCTYHLQNAHRELDNWDIRARRMLQMPAGPEKTKEQQLVDHDGVYRIRDVWIMKSAKTYVFFQSRLEKGWPLARVMKDYLCFHNDESPYPSGKYPADGTLNTPLVPWDPQKDRNKQDWLLRYSGFKVAS